MIQWQTGGAGAEVGHSGRLYNIGGGEGRGQERKTALIAGSGLERIVDTAGFPFGMPRLTFGRANVLVTCCLFLARVPMIQPW